MFYIPSNDVILYRVQHGMQENQCYGITEAKEALDEIRTALKGSVGICQPAIRNIKVFDFNGVALKKLIGQARAKALLESEIRLGIEGLLAKAKRS